MDYVDSLDLIDTLNVITVLGAIDRAHNPQWEES